MSLYAQKILVLNSNDTISKYQETISSFKQEFKQPYTVFNISNKSEQIIKEYLYDEYPDIVYAVGVKAYQYAHEYLPEKDIYFSSIVNWKRLNKSYNTYGVSNELHSSMHLTLIKSIFSKVKNIGIIYSDYTSDIIEDFKSNAEPLNVNIIPYKINKSNINNESFNILLNKVDSIILIPDPILLNQQNNVKKLFNNAKSKKIALFAYHQLFLEYGALLSIAIDNPTTGRQIANMIQNNINKNVRIDRIQYPAGTKLIFNKKEALLQNVFFNKNITPLVNEIIE
jgi:putative ABC transport system substrate-binding protein